MKNNKEKNNQFRILIILCTLMICIIFTTFTLNYQRIHDLILNKDIEQTISTSKFVTRLVESEIENIVSDLKSNADDFMNFSSLDENHLIKKLNSISKDLNFNDIGIMDLNGNAINGHGEKFVIQNDQIFQSMQDKSYYISNVIELSDCMMVVVPIFSENHLIGGLWGYYQVDNISNNIELNKNSHRYFQIVDDTGEYISDSSNIYSFAENVKIWDELSRYDIHGETLDQIRENVKTKKSGEFYFKYKEQGRYVVYEPLNINNWYVFSVLTEEYLSNYVLHIERIFYLMLMIVLVCIGAVCLCVIRFIYQNTKVIKDQNGKLTALNSLLFISLNHTKDIPFKVNLEKGIISFYSPNEDKNTVVKKIEDCRPEVLLEKGILSSEYFEDYTRLFQNVIRLLPSKDTLVRLKIKDQWQVSQIHYEVVANKIVGCLEDYNEQDHQYKQMAEMQNKIQIDSLTGLYNRDYVLEKIHQYILEDDHQQIAAIFILDLDCFKQANDTLGHLIGDHILKNSARAIKKCVRSTDVCGRLGGDEFILFVQGIQNKKDLEVIARKINHAVYQQYENEGKQVQISASIGIAVLNSKNSIDELYNLADKALYKVKESGRNGFYILEDVE